MDFYKYQGLGNHFILLDRRSLVNPVLAPEVVVQLCCANRGIGADGILTVVQESDGYPRMHIQNADGSDAGMCGNGLRCVVRYLEDCGELSAEQTWIKVWVADNLYDCRLTPSGEVSVDMGIPLRSNKELPAERATGEELEVEVLGRTFKGTCQFFGNPHFSVFVDEDESPMILAKKFGQELESHSYFPNRVNVSFSRSLSNGFETVVYERGVGITQACGSGACAVGAAAVLRGYWEVGKPLKVYLPGGELMITVYGDGRVAMQGEASRVFVGRISLSR